MMGYYIWCLFFGVFKVNEWFSLIKWVMVDFELVRFFFLLFEYIEFVCFFDGGGNLWGDVNGIEIGFSVWGF